MNYKKSRFILFFIVFFLLLLFTISNHSWPGALAIIFCLILGALILLFPNSNMEENDDDFYDETDEAKQIHNHSHENCLIYYGDELDFSKDEIISILNKHLPFYTTLDDVEKEKFIKRLTAFIEDKTFKIYDKSGYKEMPVLISAAAIQVSFGLEEFILSHFVYIHIHPVEFIGIHPGIRVLEGNVSGNSINISWKYFLEGFQYPQDGKNVGLHEMAHAYYYQNFGPCENKEQNFISAFDKFNDCGNKIYTDIQTTNSILYSDYAKRNFQEFWAESVELFFEKSMEFKNIYPDLYACVSGILNQDPTKYLFR